MSAPSEQPAVKEAGTIWLASIVLSAIFGLIGLAVPLVADNLLALVAATFLYLPAWVLWRRNVDLQDYGLRAAPLGKGLTVLALVTLIVLPPFYLGHHYWQALVFDNHPVYADTALHRLDRDLEGRPTLPSPPGTHRLWLEGHRLFVISGSDASLILRVTVAAGHDPIRDLRGLTLDEDGKLRTGSHHAKLSADGTLAWSGRAGSGFSVNVEHATGLSVHSEEVPIRIGRYGVSINAPYETQRSPWWPLLMFLTQIILVALPEEWFYRGYLQKRLDEGLGTPWRVMGANMGWGWLLSSILFAVGHLVLDPRPTRLAVFFPSLLFGWMRSRTDSILASTLFHAVCNVWIQGLGYLYIG